MITLFGHGKTTQAIARHHRSECVIFDDALHEPSHDTYGNALLPSHLFDPSNSTLEIPSPGIPPSHPLIRSAEHLISEYDFLLPQTPKMAIWISGTNGKTTTTQMVTHLLGDKGAISGGNIGTPLADMDPSAPIWILETSSFSMHYTRHASPNIYALLPITPDHISWHGSMEEYIAAKLKPLATMREGEVAILPRAYANTPTKAFIIPYDTEADLAAYFGIDTTRVGFKGAFLMDALIAMGIDKILFDRIAYDTINAFVLDPHRQEEFHDARGRLWINDSKATNLDATLAAMRTYHDRSIHLILGGDDKGVELDTLFEALTHYHVHVYAIGSNATRIMSLCQHYTIPCTLCHTLDVAIAHIDRVLDADTIALLSPAAASLDQFRSYAHRGEWFKELVGNLPKN